ncbi:MAG: lipopolysaccharide biosynthesis protein [Paludibacter sp.]
MGDNLKGKMVDALTWTSIDRFGQQAVQLIIGLIYARLLSPEEFGIIGLVMIFVTLSYVFIESGFTQALIRKKNATDTDYNTVFYFNIIASISIYLILYFSAPTIANYFHQPKLIDVSRVVFLVIVFNSFCLVPATILTKELNFKTLAFINISSIILSGSVGIFLALNKYGVWALVAQQTLFVFIRWINFNLFFKWKPKLLFQFSIIKEFASFSFNLLITALLNAIFNNIFLFLLGLFYPIKQVGFYTQGNKLSETFNFSIQSVLSASTYPLFAKIQDDNDRLLRIYREIIKKVAIVVFPVLISLYFVAKPFISVLLTSKFLASVPYFQLLVLASIFTPFYLMNINILNSRGKSRTTFIIELTKKVLIIIAIVLCFKYGILVMLRGYAIVCFIAFLVSAIIIKSELMYYFKHQFNDIYKSILIAIAIGYTASLLSYFVSTASYLLMCQILTCAILYVFSVWKFYFSFFTEIKDFIVKKINFQA